MITVLYVRRDSQYKKYSNVDCYDIDRDARLYAGSNTVIAHPPCRGWGRLRGLAKPRDGEKELAIQAVQVVRTNGGILEHPESSDLWRHCELPRPHPNKITIDQYGGFTFPVAQHWFGHKARKNTWLYICGIRPDQLPDFPLHLGEAMYLISSGKRTKSWKKEVTKAEREHTPTLLIEWLLTCAEKIAAVKQTI